MDKKENQHLLLLQQLLWLYQDMIEHDGYSNINLEIKKCPGNKRKVTINAGKHYVFEVPVGLLKTKQTRFQVIDRLINTPTYQGMDRRQSQRRKVNRRGNHAHLRHFKIDLRRNSGRRTLPDRRQQ